MKSMSCIIFMASFLFMNTSPAAQPQPQTSDTLAVDQYSAFVNGLNFQDIDSVSSARNRAIKLMPGVSQSARDKIFLEFEKHYVRVQNAQFNSSITLAQNFNSLLTKLNRGRSALQYHPYYRLLKQNGYDIFWSEGYAYVDQQPDYLNKAFAKYLSPALAVFLNIRARERADIWAEDAGLNISFLQLGERVHTWESYLAKYPDSPYRTEAKDFLDSYLRVFMTGMDNSRIYEYETRILRKDVREAYEFYINKYPDTPTGRLIKAYYEIYKQNKYRKTSAAEEFLKKNHVESFLGIQPDIP